MSQWTLDNVVPQPQEIRSNTNHFKSAIIVKQLVETGRNIPNRLKGPSLKID